MNLAIGGVPERSNGAVSKTVVPFGAPGVRIPPPPQGRLQVEGSKLKVSCRTASGRSPQQACRPGSDVSRATHLVIRLHRALLVVLFSCLGAAPSQAQLYETWHRPADVRYRALQSPHFRIVYQTGLRAEAAEMARLLEDELPEVRAMVGLCRPLKVPVVINRFGDRGNGFLTPMPFRQEIETARLLSNELSPRFPSWFETVAPHELVHAAHAESGHGFGFGWILRLFGDDLARSLNLSGPRGVNEGLAVWYESRRYPDAGRLHHSLFEMQLRAAMLSDSPWSLAQMLEPPSYTRPFDRYYIGGAHLFEYMEQRDGDLSFFRRARSFYYRFPLLGYGLPLWYGTRMAPHVLAARLRAHFRQEVRRQIASEERAMVPQIISGRRGTAHRRPVWIDKRTLLVHATGYHHRPGFYKVDALTGETAPVAYHAITEDYLFSLSPDSSTILFSRYVPDRLEAIRLVSEVFQLDLADGHVRRVAPRGRLHSPVFVEDGKIWATRSLGQFNQWVEVDPVDGTRSVAGFDRTTIKSILPSPHDDRLVMLANVRGRQGIYEVEPTGEGIELVPRIVFDDASVFDASWGPEGEYLLFAADLHGVSNVYAWDAMSGEVYRLTNVEFGAIEPSLSPDRSRVAFINFRHERYDLVQIPFEPRTTVARPTADAALIASEREPSNRSRSLASPKRGDGSATRGGGEALADVPLEGDGRYIPLLEMRPRVIYPFILYQRPTGNEEDVHLGFGAGSGLEWSDPLQYWTAHTSAFYQHNALWGRLLIRSGQFILRSSAEVFREPSTVVVRRIQGARVDTVRLGRDERGVGVGVSLPAVLEANVFQTRAQAVLTGEYRNERLFDVDGPIGERDDLITLRPGLQLQYRTQRNLRDIVPNSGWVLSTFARLDAWSRRDRAARFLRARGELYLPFLRASSTGLALHASVHSQNRGGIVDLTTFFPRGYEAETVFLDGGTYGKVGFEVTQPFWYIDDGFVLLPLYFRALFAYAFIESMQSLNGTGSMRTVAGGGLGLQARFAYGINFTLRAAPVFRFLENDWSVTFR